MAVLPGSLVYSEVKKVGPSLFQMAVLASGVWVNSTGVCVCSCFLCACLLLSRGCAVAVPAYVAPLVMAYVVLEHQPSVCSEFPADGVFVFSSLEVRPGGGSGWSAHNCAPACGSAARVLDAASVAIAWNSSATTAGPTVAARMCVHPHNQ